MMMIIIILIVIIIIVIMIMIIINNIIMIMILMIIIMIIMMMIIIAMFSHHPITQASYRVYNVTHYRIHFVFLRNVLMQYSLKKHEKKVSSRPPLPTPDQKGRIPSYKISSMHPPDYRATKSSIWTQHDNGLRYSHAKHILSLH